MALTDLLGGVTGATSGADEPARRWIDRLDRRVVWALSGLGFALPVVFCYWMVAHYGVNVVTGDQFDDVTVIQSSYTHLSWGALWAQHNENRIFFPNLVMLVLAHATAFNIKTEELVGVTMLVAATVLVLLTHRRRAPGTPWLYYCPAVVLMLSIAQFGNMLWGFQMAWYLVLLALTLCLYLVDRITLSWPVFVAAAVVAVVASYSSLQGLLVWPAGLILLYHRRRPRTMAVTWIVIAVADIALYFYNYNSHVATSPHGAAITHPFLSMEYFATAVGDVLGITFRFKQAYDPWLVILGLVITVAALWVTVRYGIRRDDESSRPFAVALIVTGLLFVLVITEGRMIFGAWSAGASRYTTMELLVLVGMYLALLGPLPAGGRVWPWGAGGADNDDPATPRRRTIDRWAVPVLRCFVALVIVAQGAVSIPNGITGARSNYVYQSQAAQVLRNINHLPNGEVVYFLYVYSNASYLRRQAAILERYHLSVFAGTTAPQGLSSSEEGRRQGPGAVHGDRTAGIRS